jgi:hypothetical protein
MSRYMNQSSIHEFIFKPSSHRSSPWKRKTIKHFIYKKIVYLFDLVGKYKFLYMPIQKNILFLFFNIGLLIRQIGRYKLLYMPIQLPSHILGFCR